MMRLSLNHKNTNNRYKPFHCSQFLDVEHYWYSSSDPDIISHIMLSPRRPFISGIFHIAAIASLVRASQPADDGAAPSSLTLHASSSLPAPNDHRFYGIGGVTYDAASGRGRWTGVSEGNPGAGLQKKVEAPRIHVFDVDWDAGAVEVVRTVEISPGGGLKCEGIARVPMASDESACGRNASSSFSEEDEEYWVVSESNCKTYHSCSPLYHLVICVIC